MNRLTIVALVGLYLMVGGSFATFVLTRVLERIPDRVYYTPGGKYAAISVFFRLAMFWPFWILRAFLR